MHCWHQRQHQHTLSTLHWALPRTPPFPLQLCAVICAPLPSHLLTTSAVAAAVAAAAAAAAALLLSLCVSRGTVFSLYTLYSRHH